MSKVCKSCGNVLDDGDKFCQKCGAVVESNQPTEKIQNTQTTNNSNYKMNSNTINGSTKTCGMAIGGFVCSLVGLIIMHIPLGILSISLGAAALNHLKTFTNEKGKGLAIAGIVIGIIDIIVSILITSLLVLLSL